MRGNNIFILIPVVTVVAVAISASVFCGANARAQQPAYSQWQDPNRARDSDQGSEDHRLQTMINKINDLIDQAERDQAADPAFLRDLRNLTGDIDLPRSVDRPRGADQPWWVHLFGDEFQDGNFTADPVWTVSSGKYWVEQGWGLRSAVDAAASDQKQAEQPKKRTSEEKAMAIFGQILGQVLNKRKSSGTAAVSNAPAKVSEAAIHSAARISNVFMLEADFSSWSQSGRMQFAIYQGEFRGNAAVGYRLVYMPGGQLEMLRISRRGTQIIDSTTLSQPLEDKKTHRLTWKRHEDGRMSVSVDGLAVLDGRDLGFRDSFDGVALINSGGDYIIKRLSLMGTP